MDKRELGIYIHIPFCVRKCRYCDFLSFPCGEAGRAKYVDSICMEIELRGRSRMDCEIVTSVFFGGGTPSVLEPGQIGRILETIREHYHLSEDAEITMELNPGTADEKKLADYRRLGINRLSMGAQSTNDEELKLLGRIHDRRTFFETFRMARQAGFENINVDLMAALPGQSLETFRRTLTDALSLEPDHLSVYSLIIEEGTPFGDLYGEDDLRRQDGEKPKILPDEETERQMYAETLDLLAKAGYHRYEISNYARDGRECRHNNNCWKRVDYLGFGIGAASLYLGQRWDNIRDINKYMELMSDTAHGPELCGDESLARIRKITDHYEVLSVEDQMAETMFLGLRRMEGVSENGFVKAFHRTYDEVYGAVTERLVGAGLLVRENGRIRLTMKGLDVANYCMAQFLPEEK